MSRATAGSRSSDDGKSEDTVPAPKPTLYQRWQEKKRSKPISDGDLMKYLGVTRTELMSWADQRPGVGKNQLAGKISQGSASGFGGMATAHGFGGWGHGAEPAGKDRGMKFPPATAIKALSPESKLESLTSDDEYAGRGAS
jgi:hypothetical protein